MRPAFGVLARVFGRGFPQVGCHGFGRFPSRFVYGLAHLFGVSPDGHDDFIGQVVNFDNRDWRSPPRKQAPFPRNRHGRF